MSSQQDRALTGGQPRTIRAEIRRAVEEFLWLPSAIVAGFLFLALVTDVLDRSAAGWLQPVRSVMQGVVFNHPQSTGDLLGTIASSVITVTSITISLVLLAVQQSAGSLTFQVIDQFIRRRINQFTFGFFVGLAIYSLVILATVDPPFNPVIGATVALLLVMIALFLLLILLYTTINQMRPSTITNAIHDHTLAAREQQLSLLRRTRRYPLVNSDVGTVVRSPNSGFVVGIDLDGIGEAIDPSRGETEVVLLISVGSYVAYGDAIAEIRSYALDDMDSICKSVEDGVHLEYQRDLTRDPAYGIEQFVNIGWTSISTSKQNPQSGLLAIRRLRDLLARWAVAGGADRSGKGESGSKSGQGRQPGPSCLSRQRHGDVVRRTGVSGSGVLGVAPAPGVRRGCQRAGLHLRPAISGGARSGGGNDSADHSGTGRARAHSPPR